MKDFLKNIIPARRADSHKGDYGHVLVLAGSAGLTGAAALCSQAALRAGCGLVTLGIPASLNPAMEAKLTEVMTKPLPETPRQSLAAAAKSEIMELLKKADSVALGPGISQISETQALVRELVAEIEQPLIIDADGINALAGNLGILRKPKTVRVITPHPGEMGRLMGMEVTGIQKEREQVAAKFAREFQLVVALKGYRTVVAAPDGTIYQNTTGNPGMATAGSGDVLTGIIVSFLGQGIEPFAACKAAVYLHGRAGDLAAEEKGQISVIAGDILDKLPEAFKEFEERENPG